MGELGIYGLESEVEFFASVVDALLQALEMSHPHSGLRAHAQRVARVSVEVAQQMGVGVIERDHLRYGALLHDIGKIALPTNLLFPDAHWSPDQHQQFEAHTLHGQRLCLPLRSAQALLPFIHSHHEKLDGSGFPHGLHEDELSRPLQILAVANAYDNLRNPSPQQSALEHRAAMTTLRAQAAHGWWNREAVELMKNCGT